MSGEFKHQSWVLHDPMAISLADDLVWGVLRYSVLGKQLGTVPAPELPPAMLDILNAHEIAGLAAAVYGQGLPKEILNDAELSRQRSDIFLHELNWLVGPALGSRVIAIGAAAVQPLYRDLAGKGASAGNPRHVRSLSFWAPTLQAREELGAVLKLGAYQAAPAAEAQESSLYLFSKNTAGIDHTVSIRSVLWPSSKNWSTDVERAIWDRAREDSSGKLKLETTDLLILCIRFFAVDTLLGGAAGFLDVLRLLSAQEDNIDWQRIRAYKNQFGKCDWFWAAFFAAELFEKKCGIGLRLPGWVREGLAELEKSFWPSFVESRLAWACPDSRHTDFTRAHVKLARGT